MKALEKNGKPRQKGLLLILGFALLFGCGKEEKGKLSGDVSQLAKEERAQLHAKKKLTPVAEKKPAAVPGKALLPEKKDFPLTGEQKGLEKRAELFMEAYEKPDYKILYGLLNAEYRARVPFWEYKDLIEFPPVTDGFLKVEIAQLDVVAGGKLGKVIIKFSTYGTDRELVSEFYETQDWIYEEGNWYHYLKIR